jgi:hypothetical protein
MTYGSGSRKAKTSGGAKTALIVGGAVMVLVGGGLLAMSLMRANAHDQADAAAYALQGDPCPAVAVADLAPKPHHTFEYDGLSLSRAAGEVDCAEVKGPGGFMGMGATRYPVCRFSSPGSLDVKDGAKELAFAPLVGKEVAIVKQGDQLKCVVASRG